MTNEPKEDLELLLARAEQVRDARAELHRQRNDTNKRKTEKLERQLDDVLEQMRRKGYNGDRFKAEPTRARLF